MWYLVTVVITYLVVINSVSCIVTQSSLRDIREVLSKHDNRLDYLVFSRGSDKIHLKDGTVIILPKNSTTHEYDLYRMYEESVKK